MWEQTSERLLGGGRLRLGVSSGLVPSVRPSWLPWLAHSSSALKRCRSKVGGEQSVQLPQHVEQQGQTLVGDVLLGPFELVPSGSGSQLRARGGDEKQQTLCLLFVSLAVLAAP